MGGVKVGGWGSPARGHGGRKGVAEGFYFLQYTSQTDKVSAFPFSGLILPICKER